MELRAAIAYGPGRVNEAESLERLAVRVRAHDSTNLRGCAGCSLILGLTRLI